jgi:hypothetical protein
VPLDEAIVIGGVIRVDAVAHVDLVRDSVQPLLSRLWREVGPRQRATERERRLPTCEISRVEPGYFIRHVVRIRRLTAVPA